MESVVLLSFATYLPAYIYARTTSQELEGEYLIPGGRSHFDCFLEPVNGGYAIKQWADITPAFIYSPSVPFFNLIVPTLDTTRYSFLLQVGKKRLVALHCNIFSF